MPNLINFVEIIAGLSAIAIFSGFFAVKYADKKNKRHLMNRAWGLFFLSVGFILETLGDFVSIGYTLPGLNFETGAHVIILISLIFFINSSRGIINEERGKN